MVMRVVMDSSEISELVAFLQESINQVLQDIYLDCQASSHARCHVENCSLDPGNISCLLSSPEEERDEDPSAEALDTVELSSLSNGSESTATSGTEHGFTMDSAVRNCGTEGILVQIKGDLCPCIESNEDPCMKKTLTNQRNIHGKKSEVGSRTMTEGDSSPPDVMGSNREGSHGMSDCLKVPTKIETIPKVEDMNRDRFWRPSQSSTSIQAYGEASLASATHSSRLLLLSDSSGTIPCSSTASLRSNSCNDSTRSFAFPILESEWDESPVRMAQGDRRNLRKSRRKWLLCLLCFKY